MDAMEPKPKRPGPVTFLRVGLVLLVTAGVIYVLRPIWQEQGVVFSAKQGVDNVEFDIRLKNSYGLDEFIVVDRQSKERLWSVNLNYYPGHQLIYGKVPSSFRTDNGSLNSATQDFPKSDQPVKALIVGKEYMVQIGFMYHEILGDSGSTWWFAFVIEPDGKIRCWRVEPDWGTYQ
jgi:hypothetical protein